jgi:trans-2-enoyl-CoA reductase
VLLIKKLMLVGASSTFVTAAPLQAAVGFGVNLAYLALFETKKPMPFRPSTSAWF